MSILSRLRREPSLLVLVRTCDAHDHYVERFWRSELGEVLRGRPRTRVVLLDADPTLDEPRLDGNRLTVPVPEAYELLCSKMQAAYQFALANFAFDSLLRIDVTVVMTDEEMAAGPFGGRSAIHLPTLAEHVLHADYRGHYGGFLLHERPDRAGIENWARVKGLQIDYAALFSDAPVPPYYSGKCAHLSRAFLDFVVATGEPLVRAHNEHLAGSDDLLLGVLYEQFRRTTGDPPLVPPGEPAARP